MSTIFDMINERPVTKYFFYTTVVSTLYFYVIGGNPQKCFFISPYFLSGGEIWRIVTSPFVCPGAFNLIFSCGCILYFGLRVENRLDSLPYLKVLCFGHLILVLISIVIYFIPSLPNAFYPIIIGPSCLVVMFLQILAYIDPSFSIHIMVDIPVSLFPYIAWIFYAALNHMCAAELFALILANYFPDLFPSLIHRNPDESQNMRYNSHGFWEKKPTVKKTRFSPSHFSGTPRSLDE